MRAPAGNERMKQISGAIAEGAIAYLNRQLKSVAIAGIIIFSIIAVTMKVTTAVGFLVGAMGGYAVRYLDPEIQRRLLAVSNILIGALMMAAGLMHNVPGLKICRRFRSFYRPGLGSFLYGLFSGLNICPPFFMAASRVFGRADGWAGMLYFAAFFLGTSVYFLPLLGVHLFRDRLQTVRLVARLTLILLGAYFLLFQGIFYGSVGRFQ